jgi:hypothetical protein
MRLLGRLDELLGELGCFDQGQEMERIEFLRSHIESLECEHHQKDLEDD